MILLNSSDIEAIIMESVNERTKEAVLRYAARAGRSTDLGRDNPYLHSAREALPLGRMASQAYRSVAVLASAGS
jgi:hypothetical protein